MVEWEDELVDAFLADVGEDVDPVLEAFSGPVEAPPPDLRARLLSAATIEGRFDRFAARVARLLDVDEAEAKSALDGIGDSDNWHGGLVPDVTLYDVDGGPKVRNAITGFVRIPGGVTFPEHEHLGTEHTLIVQGSCVDHRGDVWRVGDLLVEEPGEPHVIEARPGPDLVFLVVIQNGVRIGDVELGPDDPRV